MKAILFSLGVGVLLATAPFAGATTVNFTTGTSNDGTIGNSLCYSSTGTSTACNGSQFLTITAWGVTGSNSTTFQAAALGNYAGTNLGLGVCNASEGVGCQSPNHEVDNSGHFDFVLFQFSSAISAASVTLNPVCDCDTDSTYYTGNLTSSISGKTLAGLNAAGLTNVQTRSGSFDQQQNFSLTGISSSGANTILLGASTSSSDDYFKIGSLTFTPQPSTQSSVPEPGSLTSLGLGLGLLGWFGKRRMAKRASQN
jgi:hypothetical protein